jgi:hypothetical protein
MKALQVKNSSGLDGPAAAMLTKFRQKEKLKIKKTSNKREVMVEVISFQK